MNKINEVDIGYIIRSLFFPQLGYELKNQIDNVKK